MSGKASKKAAENKEDEAKNKEMLDILEDDDEFEEFEQVAVTGQMEDVEYAKQWYKM